MTKIKSAWEKAMERFEEKNKQVSAADIMHMECREEGQKLVGLYLTNPEFNLTNAIAKYDVGKQSMILEMMGKTFLSRLALPEDEQSLQDNLAAMKGLMEVKQNKEALSPVLGQLENLFNYYLETLKQARSSLEQQLVSHLEEIMRQKGMRPGPGSQVKAKMHPKYQEEWSKLVARVNEKFMPPFTQMRLRIDSIK